MKNECVCKKLLRGKTCENCGRVYNIGNGEYIEDKELTQQNIKKFILENTSVSKHSLWGYYYDFPIVSKETIGEYVIDMNRHKEQVKIYLEKFDTHYLIELRNQIEEGIGGKYLADRILTSIGYKYTELQKIGVEKQCK